MLGSKNKSSNIIPYLFTGADRLYENIVDMIGYRPLTLMKYCWKYVTPIVCLVSKTLLLLCPHCKVIVQYDQCCIVVPR